MPSRAYSSVDAPAIAWASALSRLPTPSSARVGACSGGNVTVPPERLSPPTVRTPFALSVCASSSPRRISARRAYCVQCWTCALPSCGAGVRVGVVYAGTLYRLAVGQPGACCGGKAGLMARLASPCAKLAIRCASRCQEFGGSRKAGRKALGRGRKRGPQPQRCSRAERWCYGIPSPHPRAPRAAATVLEGGAVVLLCQ